MSFWNISIQWTSHDDLTEKSAENFFSPILKKFVKSECQEGCLNDLTYFCLCMGFLKKRFKKNVSKIFKLIWRTNAWMDTFKKKNYYFSLISTLCRIGCFCRKWLTSIRICMILNFSLPKYTKSYIFYLKKAIHSGNNLIWEK